MVHYIRLLRTPQVGEATKKSLNVSAVAAVTTDLGDSFLAQSTTLIARIVDATNSGEILSAQDLQWEPGARAIKINVPCSDKHVSRLVYLHVTTKETIAKHSHPEIPEILDVWSARFTLKVKQRSEPLVERRLQLNGKCKVRIWEETGDSIARHIWDASLGFLEYFQHWLSGSNPSDLPTIQKLFNESKPTRLKVLEVGAGCGIVGIALAQMCKSDVVLTDLEDAQEILQSNIDCATLSAGSSIRRQVLGWGPSLGDLSDSKFHLVLVSDCIYNPDSSVLLVETLEQISKHNPTVLVLVGFKRRHDADDVFFERMQQQGFIVAEDCENELPHTVTEYDSAEPKFEMFVYRGPT